MDVTVVYFGFWKWTLLAYAFRFSVSVFFSFCFILCQFVVKRVNILFFFLRIFIPVLSACLYFLDKEWEHIWAQISLAQWVGLHRLWWDCVLILDLVFLCLGLFYLELPVRFCEHDGLFSYQYVHKKGDCLIWTVRRRMSNHAFDIIQVPSSYCCSPSLNMRLKLPYTSLYVPSSDYCLLTDGSKSSGQISIGCKSKNKTYCRSLAFNVVNSRCRLKMSLGLSTG